ncbi:hypothetical protein LIER_37437 [Lithospermum erythrorhizon]|uniref:Uncharacterized protein n=1 Tax=Lithospermum erythrorhizon TaxID=34254 RepID=A0AAV3PKK5_LITER
MSSHANINKSSNHSRFDEHQWVMQIRQTLEEELEEDNEIEVCIFSVPKTLMATHPHCYTPQMVPIGPYHYFHQETYEMERYKLSAAKRVQQNCFENIKFEDVVLQLRGYESRIRACYNRYLTINGETLAWMMAVDASFILEFLQVYSMSLEGRKLLRISSRMSHLVGAKGKKSTHNEILKDFFMVENQIPLFVLRKMMEVKFHSLEIGDGKLYLMLMGLFKVLCPFEVMHELPETKAMDCAHLLDMLYRLIVPKLKPKVPEVKQLDKAENTNNVEAEKEKERNDEQKPYWGSQYVNTFFEEVWKIIKNIFSGPINILRKILLSRVVVFITKLPWQIVSNVPGIRFITGPIETLFSTHKDEDRGDEDEDDEDKPPIVEEIEIPSVTELTRAYLKFEAVEGSIFNVKFDPKTVTLYLPSISLDENSEVIMRNLVAYEACNASGPAIFSRYTELMNGIIDTKEDVQILKETGIIKNRLKSDEDVIEDVNKYYKGRWKVKLKHMMMDYVFGSWQILTLMACIALLVLMSLQSFCSVYSCSRFFPIQVIEVTQSVAE